MGMAELAQIFKLHQEFLKLTANSGDSDLRFQSEPLMAGY
jgi:hypothetical protein